MKVGWIGAGRMGSPMALRAARASHTLRIFATQITDEAALRAAGATIAASAAEAVEDAELVCLCVFDDGQGRDVMLGPDGALRHMRHGAILAVHSSAGPRLVLDLAAAAPPGVHVLDAPFSGQQAGALTMLVGGAPEALEAARSVFEAYASLIVPVGAPGAAQRVKLVNQFLFRANAAAADAALRVLEGHGMSRAEIVPALMACSGASFALGTFAHGQPLSELTKTFQPYFEGYLAAARADGLPIEALLRRGEPEPDVG